MNGDIEEIGLVKIAKTGMGDEGGDVELPATFAELGADYFSVGQEREYYESLRELPDGEGKAALEALRDIALNEHARKLALAESVTYTSLFRVVGRHVVEQQFSRIAKGGATVVSYSFGFDWVHIGSPPVRLDFSVKPGSVPPTNIHVLIGPNGVGKTTLLRAMERALLTGGIAFKNLEESTPVTPFATATMVAFSAFDPFEMPEPDELITVNERGTKVSYVGLKKRTEPDRLAAPSDLAHEFYEALVSCSVGARRQRWKRAMETLAQDALLAHTRVPDLLDGEQPPSRSEADRVFNALSSGHKIAVLALTTLVSTVEERSLVLFDEPETHLHPPLVSALLRALSELLEERNGVAIIATHSPVVLQEVPASNVYTVMRVGSVVKAERLERESFGAGVGDLTAAVFGLEVTHTGFHQLLRRVASEEPDYPAALQRFSGRLGGEGRSILRSISKSGP